MAIGPGPRAEYRADVNEEAQHVVDGDDFDSSAGFARERAASEREYSRSLAEIERNPDACRQILESDDADSQLFHQILRDRRGIGGFFRGIWNRFRESGIGRTLGMAGAGMAVRSVVNGSLGLGGPVTDILIGGGMGAISGYTRAKEQTEGAAVWMSELGILRASNPELSRLDSGHLMTALGIMRNAIMDNRVRGNDATRFEMVLKYRQIKQLLGQRRNEARDAGETMNPALAAIDQMMGESNDDFNLVSRAAGEKYRKSYETVRDLNRNKVMISTIKGFALGSTIGGVLGWMFNHGGLQGAADWIKDHFGGGAQAAASPDALLQAKADALSQSAQIAGENADHAANLDTYNQVMSGDVSYDSLSESNRALVDHLSKLQGLADQGEHASIMGLHTGEITQVDSILQGADPAQNLEQFANAHNIDMSVTLPNGEEFGNYLVEHKDAFIALPPEIQHFILSHPSVAEQLIEFNGSPNAAMALIDKFSGPIALAGAGVGALWWRGRTNAQRNIDSDVSKVMRGAVDESRKEVTGFDREQLRTRQESLRSRLIGNRVTILATAPAAIAGLVPAARGSRQYDISGIEADGRLRFEDNDWDRTERTAGRDPHPNITLQQISNNNQTELNPAIAVLAYNTPEALATARERERERREQRETNTELSRQRLRGGRVEFTPAFLAAAARAYPAATPGRRTDGRFDIIEVGPAPNEFLSFRNTPAEDAILAGGGTVTHPRVRFRDLVTPDGLLNTPNPIKVLKEGRGTATTTPETPAVDLDGLKTAFEGLDFAGGTLVNSGGKLVFRLPSAVGGRTDLPLVLSPDLKNAPTGTTLTCHVSSVKLEGDNPVFEAEVYYNYGTNNYRFNEVLAGGVSGPKLAEKTSKVDLLGSAAAGNPIIFIPMLGAFCRIDSFVPSTSSPPTATDPGVFTLTNLTSGGSTMTPTRTDLINMPFTTLSRV